MSEEINSSNDDGELGVEKISNLSQDFGDGEQNTDRPTDTEVQQENEESENKDDDIELVAANNTRVSYNVTLSEPVYIVKKQEPEDKRTPAITLVPKRIHRLVENDKAWITGPDDVGNTKTAHFLERWMYGTEIQPASSFHEDRGWYERTLDDPNAEWGQGLEADGKTISARRPVLGKPTARRELTGQAARERAAQATGVGITTRVPLPHTGVHFRLLPRSSQDYIDLDYNIALDRIRTGRSTIGLMFQNSHIYHVKHVWDFILESTADINIQNFGDIDPGDFVRVTDLPMLQWGMACTMFPHGYPLDLPCSSGVQVCTHVEQVNLDLEKLLWVNGKGLSKSQSARLGNASHKCSLHDLAEYQDNFVSPFKRRVAISDNCELVLKVPTVNEYIKAGTDWIESLTQSAINIFGQEESNEERIRGYVSRAIADASLREYSHWIEEIIYDKYDAVPDRKDIEDNLRTLSATPELVETALKVIQDFIEDCTIALIGIPNFSCPKCETDYVTDDHSKHPEIIPLDMLKHFFPAKDLRLALHRREPKR